MGIKNYLTNITELFPEIIESNTPKDIDILCVDLNSILHKICNKSKDNIQFEKLLIKELNKLVKIYKPNTFALFTDGQAVLAKATLQIKRRNKNLYTESTHISSLNLTPGTIFMEFIDNLIVSYLNKLQCKIYYSSSKINNEGELKMFKYLKQNSFEKICIIGNDADLIVLALSNTPLLDLYINNFTNTISLYKLVDSLSKLCELKFNYKYHPIRKDMTLISLFLGNDYNKTIINFKNIMNSYKLLLKNNSTQESPFLFKKNGHFNFNNLKKLLQNINRPNDKIFHQTNINKYFNSLIWNMKLYNGNPIPNYIPDYSINITTLLKFFPKKITSELQITSEWLHPNVFLLLLMPSTGKELIPVELQSFMSNESPINDLFPLPCPICIEFKNKIRSSDKDDENYSSNIAIINEEYQKHISILHKIGELPIKRIQNALNIN